MSRRPPLLATLIAAALLLPGCVVTDIRDELVRTNQTLEDVEVALIQLRQTNQRMISLQRQLQTLNSIDTSLSSVDVSLASVNEELDRVETSLQAMDEHMGSLRTTITSIDNAIPFLSIAAPPEEEPADPEAIGDDPVPGVDGSGKDGADATPEQAVPGIEP